MTTPITKQQADHVLTCIDLEGFDYCFRTYSSFKDITDIEFRQLITAYREAAKNLEDFLWKHAPNHESS